MKAIDLFAGAGGFTLGAEAAGADVVWAGNHWPFAVATHALNHPKAIHVCQDLHQADWSKLPAYDLLLAGPACQGHSEAAQPARAKDPSVAARHDHLRTSAWAVVDCADATEPRAIIVENVPEFREWRLLEAWKGALRDLGYYLQEHLLHATDAGVPQRRRRYFLVATRRPVTLTWETGRPEPAFGPCIDWDAGEWRPIAQAPAQVRARIAKARRLGRGERFLTQHVTGHPGVPLHEPIRTVTTKDQWAVVDGDKYRPLTIPENLRAMTFPEGFRFPLGATRTDIIRSIGNAVPGKLAKRVVEKVMDAAA